MGNAAYVATVNDVLSLRHVNTFERDENISPHVSPCLDHAEASTDLPHTNTHTRAWRWISINDVFGFGEFNDVFGFGEFQRRLWRSRVNFNDVFEKVSTFKSQGTNVVGGGGGLTSGRSAVVASPVPLGFEFSYLDPFSLQRRFRNSRRGCTKIKQWFQNVSKIQ
jgi:hypothetical protein